MTLLFLWTNFKSTETGLPIGNPLWNVCLLVLKVFFFIKVPLDLQRQQQEQNRNMLNIQQQQTQQVQQLLKQQQLHPLALTLPQPEVPTFAGDPIEYCRFIRAFESMIVAKTTS